MDWPLCLTKCDIERVKPFCQIRNLGVHVDNYVTFDDHVSTINHWVMGTLMYINRVKHYFDEPKRVFSIQSITGNEHFEQLQHSIRNKQ